MKTMIMIAGAAALLLAGPANATAGIAPPNTLLTAQGAATLANNNTREYWPCTLAFSIKTGPAAGSYPTPRASGGDVMAISAIGNNCEQLTFNPATFVITDYFANGGTGYNTDGGHGVLRGLTVKQRGVTWCQAYGDVPFTFYNNGAGASDIYFDYAAYGQNCTIGADLKTCPDANVVQ